MSARRRRWAARARRLGVDAVWSDPVARRAIVVFLAVWAGLSFWTHLSNPPPTWFSDARGVRAVAWWLQDLLFLWIPLGWLAAWLARRFPLEHATAAHVARTCAVSALAVTAVTVAQRMAVCLLVGRWIPTGPVIAVRNYASLLLIFTAMAAVAYGLQHARRHRRHEIAATRLRARLSEAHLAALKAQLHPHFLFNTLNSVSALVGRDPAAAREMTERLVSLLTLTLERADAQEVPLAEEVRLLEMYAGIERVRFSDRLRFEVRLDPALRAALVPDLLLQPLVENAIRHGIAARPGPGRVEVSARAADGRLVLSVADDGPGPGAEPANGGSGVGLANTRARLAQLYGRDHAFTLLRNDAGGTTVTVSIPLRFAAESLPAAVPHEERALAASARD